MKTIPSITATVALLCGFGITPGTAAETLDQTGTRALLGEIAESRQSLGAVEVKFEERRESPLLREPAVSRGTLSIHPSGNFRREISGESVMVNDGETLWIHYPAFDEVEKYPVSSPGPAADLVSIISGGLRLQELEKKFRVEAVKSPAGTRLNMTPRGARLQRVIREMQIDLDPQNRLKRLEWSGARGERTTLDFANERSIPSGSEAFRFAPPSGANVVTPLGR